MSLTEVKKSVSGMSLDERLELAAFIAHLNRSEDSAYQSELDRRMAAMDAGSKTPASSLHALHDELTRQGR
jgi:hypothetical protein